VGPVLVTEELVAAADGQQRRARLDGVLEGVALGPMQVTGDGDLLLVLPAAEEEDVDLRRDRSPSPIATISASRPRQRARWARASTLPRSP
jgi:hypothetical protein